MKTQRDSSLEQILLFARGGTIYTMDEFFSISPIVNRPKFVTSLTLHNGRVLDSGNYNGVFDTGTGELIHPFIHSQAFKHIAGVKGRLFGLQKDGTFRDILEPNSTHDLEIDSIDGVNGGRTLTFWGNSLKETNLSQSNTVQNHVCLKEFDPQKSESSIIYESIAIPHNPYTRLEGFLAACESEDGRRFVVKKSGEVFLDEAHPHGLMKRVGLPKSLELAIFKRGMRICREQISGTMDEIKSRGWENFLDLYTKYKHLFPEQVWKIQDITDSKWPYKRTPKIEFKPLPYEEAYRYFESQLGEDCKRHAEFQRNQNRGNLEGGAIDYAVEAVLGNMIEHALRIHRPNAIAHLEDSIYLGTQSGRIIRLNDEIDSRRVRIFSTKTYDNDISSLRQNPNGGYWAHNNYFYPTGWAQRVDIELPTRSQKQIPITAMCVIPREIYKGTGLKQRVDELRRNRHYFANIGSQRATSPLRKAA